jgi:hypothetical protein
MHRRLAVPMLPLRVWVHCPRASNGLLPPRSNLVGYMRWHARSDSAFIPPSDNPSNSFQFANGQPFHNPVREGLLKITGPNCLRPYLSLSVIESNSLAGYFRHNWSNLCTHTQSADSARVKRRAGITIGQLCRPSGRNIACQFPKARSSHSRSDRHRERGVRNSERTVVFD